MDRGTERVRKNGRAGDDRAALIELAERVRRLAPDRRDPHRYFEEKSEIAARLEGLARHG